MQSSSGSAEAGYDQLFSLLTFFKHDADDPDAISTIERKEARFARNEDGSQNDSIVLVQPKSFLGFVVLKNLGGKVQKEEGIISVPAHLFFAVTKELRRILKVQIRKRSMQRWEEGYGKLSGGQDHSSDIRFGKVEIREHQREIWGGGGVPQTGGVPVGLSWNVEKERVRRVDSFETERIPQRIERERYLQEGHLSAEDREQMLTLTGVPHSAIETAAMEVTEITKQRRTTALSPSGGQVMQGADPDEVERVEAEFFAWLKENESRLHQEQGRRPQPVPSLSDAELMDP
mmetsp:Transcript_30017/g.77441  ORF Transcript_30017/g.77441 Transcript_30017/m.77441 type:complete len:289 (-) Transcript_30017:249-1115(-)